MHVREYREFIKAKGRNTSRSSIQQEQSLLEAYRQSKETIQGIQGLMHGLCFTGDVGLRIHFNVNTKADQDNIYKTVSDGAEGVLYENDKQVKMQFCNC